MKASPLVLWGVHRWLRSLHHVAADVISFAATFYKSHLSLILSRLLSKSQPLRWVAIWFLGADVEAGTSKPGRYFTSEQASYCLLRLFSKVRARSLRCASFPNRTRPGVCWPYGERMYPTRKRQNHVSGGTRQGKSSHLCTAVIRMCVGAALSCSGGRPPPSGGYFSAFLGAERAIFQ